jgi:hypothetical protein
LPSPSSAETWRVPPFSTKAKSISFFLRMRWSTGSWVWPYRTRTTFSSWLSSYRKHRRSRSRRRRKELGAAPAR